MQNHTEAAYRRIFERIVPEAIEFFRSKTKDYEGGPAFQLLGARGQFADINRKYWKLYQAIWEGKKLEGEQPREILMDLIGHCLLTIDCLDQETIVKINPGAIWISNEPKGFDVT